MILNYFIKFLFLFYVPEGGVFGSAYNIKKKKKSFPLAGIQLL